LEYKTWVFTKSLNGYQTNGLMAKSNLIKQIEIMKVVKSILAALLTFLMFYLIGCFVETSFDLSKWKTDTRVAVAIFGGIFSLVAFISTIQILFIEED